MGSLSDAGIDLSVVLGYLAGALILAAVLYVYFAIILAMLARKTGTRNAWMAWIPIANAVLMCRIAGKSGWTVLLLFIPVVNIIVAALIWMAIAQRRGKPVWMGLLSIVPVLNLVLPLVIALGEPGPGSSRPAPAPPPVPGYAPPQPAAVRAQASAGAPRLCAACQAPLDAGESFCGLCGRPAALPAPAVQPVSACPSCRAVCDPAEAFCGECGTPLVQPALPVALPVTAAAPPAPTAGKRHIGAWVTVLLLLAAVGGGAWWYFVGGYSQPPRLPPAIPKRLAGVLKEFPVDTDPNSPVRPVAVISRNLSRGDNPFSESTPAKWLPPGLNSNVLRQRAKSMTSAVYKAKPNESPATVHVLETQPEMPPQGRQIADDVVGGLSAPPVVTQVRVDSPQGGVYEGWRIQSPADETFVLDKRGEPLVIVVYAPDAAAKPLAERLAADIGNGEGIMDQREMKDAIWALPATLPGGAVLEETASYTPEDIGMSANQLQSGLRDVGVSAGGAAASLDQILPNRITVGSYGDPSFQTWNVMVGSYGGTAKASVAWTVVKLMVKVMQSQPLAMPGGGDGLLITESGQQFLVFRKGPYLALLAGPTAASPQMLASWAAALQL